MAVHDLNLAARYSDGMIMMKQGKIVTMGDPFSVQAPENVASVYGVEASVGTHAEVPCVLPLK